MAKSATGSPHPGKSGLRSPHLPDVVVVVVVFLIVAGIASAGAVVAAAAAADEKHTDFGYSGQHGPDHWAESFESCYGKHQSPINIEEHDVRDVHFPTLEFSGLNVSRKFSLVNNGHTAMLQASNASRGEPGAVLHMSGGPLAGVYAFEQLHFHWGENDREGSEDLINNHSFAMELHAVFYKTDYGNMSRATGYPDGLAVLAYFFEADAQDADNPVFAPLVAGLGSIERAGASMLLPNDLELGELLEPAGPPDNRLQNYFTYNGSLTTPPCSEVVTWIDFKDPLYLSHAQLAAFRDISSSEGDKLTHNFRPVQPLTDRLVLHNSPLPSASRAESSEERAASQAGRRATLPMQLLLPLPALLLTLLMSLG